MSMAGCWPRGRGRIWRIKTAGLSCYWESASNRTEKAREVMTIIYMDVDMRHKEPENENQVNDREKNCPGVEVGEIIDSPENPVLYEEENLVEN